MQTLFPEVVAPAARSSGSARHTLFFGLLPPVGVARRAHGLAEGLIRSAQVSGAVRPERVLHVSLLLAEKEMAEPPSSGLIASLRARAEAVKQRPFTVSLNRVQAWGRSGARGPVVALGDDGVFGVETLHRRVAEAFGAAARAEFNPHMTLLYGLGPPAPLAIAPIIWTVRDFVLIHSLAGLTHYEVLGRFPLADYRPAPCPMRLHRAP